MVALTGHQFLESNMYRIIHFDLQTQAYTYLSKFVWEGTFQGCQWTTDPAQALEGPYELMKGLTLSICLEPCRCNFEVVL